MNDSQALEPSMLQAGTVAGMQEGLRPGQRRAIWAGVAALVVVSALVGYFRAAYGTVTVASTSASPKPPAAKTASKPVPVAGVASIGTGKEPASNQTTPAWPMWEFLLKDPIPPREPALTPLPWRLLGASGAAGKWQLIVLRQGQTEPEYFRVGDKLPGDYRIEAISEEDVTLKHGRRQLVLSYIASR